MGSIILDSNLLVLLITGITSRNYISKHRRLRAYSEADYDLLSEVLDSASKLILTPHTLTEASNLLGQIGEPARTHIAAVFQAFIKSKGETYIESPRAADQKEFLRLWLTDAVLLAELENDHTLLTVDLDLYIAALDRGFRAENFNHIRPE